VTTIQPNSHVTVDYVLKDIKGKVLDRSTDDGGEPIRYVHGYGMLVPGLEAGLLGLKAGEEKKIVVDAAEGFGERDEELVLEIDRAEFPDPEKVIPGEEFVAESPDGDEVVMRVVELRGDSVVVDANHPLAGQTLHYDVVVRQVREATEEELQEAAADFDAAREEHEHAHAGCDDPTHDHSHAAPQGAALVTLGKKPNASAKNRPN